MPTAHAPFQPTNQSPDWGAAPRASGPDIHLESAGRGLAHMGAIGAATLKEIFKEQMGVLGNPNSSAQARAEAEHVLMGGLEINEKLAAAQESFAQGRELQAELHTQPRESFAPKGKADEIAAQMADYFSKARENMVDAGEGLSRQGALRKVLGRAGETVAGFSAGVARTAVSIQGLASRALALPGMARDRLVDKTLQAEQAIQGAITDFHAATAKRMNDLRDEAANVASAAWGQVADAGNRVKAGVESKISDVRLAGAEVAEGMRLTAKDMIDEARMAAGDAQDMIREGYGNMVDSGRQKVDSVKRSAQSVYEGTRDGAIYGVNVAKAVNNTVEAKVSDPVRNWFTQKALPAIKEFGKGFGQEFKSQLDAGLNSSMADRRAARQNRIEPTMPEASRPAMGRATMN